MRKTYVIGRWFQGFWCNESEIGADGVERTRFLAFSLSAEEIRARRDAGEGIQICDTMIRL